MSPEHADDAVAAAGPPDPDQPAPRGADLARTALARAKADAKARVAAAERGTRRAAGRRTVSPERGERGPVSLGTLLGEVVEEQGWTARARAADVLARWPQLVGDDIADHCTPTALRDGTLALVAESTAWATQLRLMSSSILGRLETEVGKDAVTELRVQGPSAPSWTRGLRKSTGPGPRDTYG